MRARSTSLLAIVAASAALGAGGCHAALQDPAYAPLVRTNDGTGPRAAAPAHGTLYVSNLGNGGSVSIYTPPYHGAPIVLKKGLKSPGKILAAPDGTLFVIDAIYTTPSILIFRPPYAAAPTIIREKGEYFWDMALDGQQRLFVSRSSSDVAIYAPPYTGAPAIVKMPAELLRALIVDDRGNLFVGSQLGAASAISEYAAPYTSAPIATINTLADCFGIPMAFALDAAHDLFIASGGGTNSSCDVFAYAPPYTDARFADISKDVQWAFGIAVAHSGRLFVLNCYLCPIGSGRGFVTAYKPPYVRGAMHVGGPTNTTAMALGPDDELFLSYYHKSISEIVAYRAPYRRASLTITAGVSQPDSLAVLP